VPQYRRRETGLAALLDPVSAWLYGGNSVAETPSLAEAIAPKWLADDQAEACPCRG